MINNSGRTKEKAQREGRENVQEKKNLRVGVNGALHMDKQLLDTNSFSQHVISWKGFCKRVNRTGQKMELWIEGVQ